MSRRIVFWVLGGLALLALPAGVALAQSVSIDLGQTGQPGATARLDGFGNIVIEFVS
jgi:hypothetical protein